MAVQNSNKDVGGRNIESSDIEYFVRGKGYIKDVSDIEEITLMTGQSGIPVKIKDVASIQIGGDIRRGMMDFNGEGEVVGGIIVMRYNENAQTIIDRVKDFKGNKDIKRCNY